MTDTRKVEVPAEKDTEHFWEVTKCLHVCQTASADTLLDTNPKPANVKASLFIWSNSGSLIFKDQSTYYMFYIFISSIDKSIVWVELQFVYKSHQK